MSSPHYYNEIDPYCAAWLRNLMDAGHIPAGDIDTRSIEDVRPDELAGYQQCHFFAGIGGWALALKLAGWSDRKLWTGSCPCQPFSVAGKGAGTQDQRHLWPAWFHLIGQCRPAIVFGEQVAAAVGHQWLDGVCADLEGQDYAIGAAVLPACAVRAPHRRDRLFFVADAGGKGLAQRERERGVLCEVGGESKGQDAANDHSLVDVAHADRFVGGQGRSIDGRSDQGGGEESWARPWSSCGSIIGYDGKARRVKSGIRLLAHGLPNRVGRLRAYGNAIVPWQAAEFIRAYCEVRGLSLANAGQAVAA